MRMRNLDLAVFDVDGTLTEEKSVWEYLLKRLNKWESIGQPNLDKYQRGLISYDEFARRDALAYRGYSFEYLDNLIKQIRRRKGVDICMNWFLNSSISIMLLSSGLSLLLDQFQIPAEKIANELLFKNNRCTGKVRVNIAIDDKANFLQEYLTQNNINPSKILVVGDSGGDLEIMDMAGLSIAVCSDDQMVRTSADFTLDNGDLGQIPSFIQDAIKC